MRVQQLRGEASVLRKGDRRPFVSGSTRAARTARVDSTCAGAPTRLRKGAGRYPQPVALLARLGVDLRHERRGLGAGLLRDVIARLVEVSDEIGCRGLLIHAESDEAREFYLHLIPGLEASPTDEMHLVLLMKDARKSLR